MMQRLTIATLIGMLTTGAVFASPAGQVLSAEDRMAEMEAQVALIKKDNELKEALRASAANNIRGLPQVVSITIVGGKRSAVLSLPNGRQDRFFEGDEIFDNLTLYSVGLRKVVGLTKQGKKFLPVTLDFSAPAAQNGQTGMMSDPNRAQIPLPASMLPMPPVVQVPSISPIRGAGMPPVAVPAQAVIPNAPPVGAVTSTARN